VDTFGQPFCAARGVTHIFPSPEILADARVAGIGMPKARAETIRALARATSDGHITFDKVVDSDAFMNRLCEIPGIGQWTAQYVAMRALGEPDAFPSGDVGLMHALGAANVRELDRRAEAWRPWRAYAAMYLWSAGSATSRRTGKLAASRTTKAAVKRPASRRAASRAA